MQSCFQICLSPLCYPVPQPDGYNFGYGHTHGAGGGASWQKESADAAGNVAGSYGLKDADGRTRVVNYVANQGGFHAHVQSNEPGVLPPVPGSQSGWQTGGYLTPVVGHVHPPGPSSGHDHVRVDSRLMLLMNTNTVT